MFAFYFIHSVCCFRRPFSSLRCHYFIEFYYCLFWFFAKYFPPKLATKTEKMRTKVNHYPVRYMCICERTFIIILSIIVFTLYKPQMHILCAFRCLVPLQQPSDNIRLIFIARAYSQINDSKYVHLQRQFFVRAQSIVMIEFPFTSTLCSNKTEKKYSIIYFSPNGSLFEWRIRLKKMNRTDTKIISSVYNF